MNSHPVTSSYHSTLVNRRRLPGTNYRLADCEAIIRMLANPAQNFQDFLKTDMQTNQPQYDRSCEYACVCNT